MKKRLISLVLSIVLLLVVFCVPANAAQPEEKILYKAPAIENTELLIQRAKLGIDERSAAAKQAVHITASAFSPTLSIRSDVQSTTQLLERKQFLDDKIVENYMTTAMVGTYSKSDNYTGKNATVYVSIYWSVERHDPYIDGIYDVYAERTNHRYTSSGDCTAYNLNAWQHQAVHTGGYSETLERDYADPIHNYNYTLLPPIDNVLTFDGGVGAGTILSTNYGTYEVELEFVVSEDVFGK